MLVQNSTYGFELLHKPYLVEQLSRILRKVKLIRGSNRDASPVGSEPLTGLRKMHIGVPQRSACERPLLKTTIWDIYDRTGLGRLLKHVRKTVAILTNKMWEVALASTLRMTFSRMV